MNSSVNSLSTADLPSPSYEFAVETRLLKQVFVYLCTLLVLAMAGLGLHDGLSPDRLLLLALPFPLLIFAILWIYGSRRMFERRYVIAADGVREFCGEQLVGHIEWPQVSAISAGQVVVSACDGQRIRFRLPPARQAVVREAISRFYTPPPLPPRFITTSRFVWTTLADSLGLALWVCPGAVERDLAALILVFSGVVALPADERKRPLRWADLFSGSTALLTLLVVFMAWRPLLRAIDFHHPALVAGMWTVMIWQRARLWTAGRKAPDSSPGSLRPV